MQHLYCREGTYYFRIRIPLDLQAHFGKHEIIRSLKSCSVQKATAFVRLLTVETENVFSRLRSEILTRAEIQRIVHQIEKTMLEVFDFGRVSPTFSGRQIVDAKTVGLVIKGARIKLSENNFEDIMPAANQLIAKLKLPISPGTIEYNILCQELIKSLLSAFEREEKRFQGIFSDETRQVFNQAGPRPHGKRLSETIREYLRKQSAGGAWRPKDTREHEDFYAQFVKIIGDKDMATYTSADALRAYEILRKIPANWRKKRELREKTIDEIIYLIEKDQLGDFPTVSETTIKKFIIWLGSLFGYAKVENPFSDFKIKRTSKVKEERDVFSKKDLQKWLDGPVYAKWKPERVRKNPERFWVPLIVLLSGLRPREACQLYKEDVRKIDGIWCFDINNDKDKSVKTIESKRIVPVHPTLIKLGFLDYYKAVKHARVFPALRNEEKGEGYAELFTKWVGKYNRQHITSDRKKVPYSLRHNFTTALSQVPGIQDSLVDEVIGHARPGETGRYHKGYSVKIKHGVIKKMGYGLDFDKVRYPFK